MVAQPHPSPAHRTRLLALALTLTLASSACGDGTGPEPIDLVGTWDFEISDATGFQVNGFCGIENLVLTFTTETEGVVDAGTTGEVVCVSTSTTRRSVTGTATLQSVTASGTSIGFQFQGLTSGALSSVVPVISSGSIGSGGRTMTGTVTFALRFGTSGGTDTRAYEGRWTATRR